MHWLDFVILIILAGGLMRGFSTGLIRQVGGIVGLLVSFVLAVQMMDSIGELVVNSLAVSPTIAPLIGFILVFAAVQLIVHLIAKAAETVVGALHLTTVNRAFGGVLGGLKAALILSVAFLILGRLQVPNEEIKQQASLYEPVASVLPMTWDYAAEIFPEVERLSEKFSAEVQERLTEQNP